MLLVKMRTILRIIVCTLVLQALSVWGWAKQGYAMPQDVAMDAYDLKTYTYGPLSRGEPKQLVILLHGLGSDGRDLIGLAPLYAQALPDAVFVSPDAPYPCDMAPMGYQWFSLQDRTPEAVLKGVERAAPVLDNFIAAQMEKYNVPAAKTALVGFSQGSMMSLYAGPRFPERLAGILAYSGAMPGAADVGQVAHKIPVHLVHGDRDDIVPVEAWHHAVAALKNAGFEVSGSVTPGLSHSIDENGVAGGRAFLRNILH